MEYVITPAVVVSTMGILMHDIVSGLFDIAGAPWWNSPVTWWAVFYVVFVWINIVGIDPGHPIRHLVLSGDRGATARRRGVPRPQA
jgi:hypothetical protein